MKLFTCMCQETSMQVVSTWKSFLAYFSSMRLITCICQKMSFQVVFSRKSFLTYFTDSVCVRRCFFRSLFWQYPLLHISQTGGFRIYESRNMFASGYFLKILSCILYKYEGLELYSLTDVFASGLFGKTFLTCFTNMMLLSYICPKMLH